MSRSGYTDDGDYRDLYRANVDRAIAGKRGQAFLAEMAKALDEMPRKRLMPSVLVEVGSDGAVENMCAMGAVVVRRKIDVSGVDEHDPDEVACALGISRMLAAEIAYINDECAPTYMRDAAGNFVAAPEETPEQRWERVRKWVRENLVAERTPEVIAGMMP